MNAEYIVKIGGDISSLEKVIKKAQGQVKRISDDEVLIKLAYDGNLKEFNKTFNQVLKSSPELTVQFQYDVNKKILNQELEKLQQLTTIKMDIETGNASAKLKTMLKSLQDSYDNIEDEDILHSKMEEILKYANTLKSLDVNFDKSGLEVLEEYAEDYKSLDALLQKNETDPKTLFKIDKSLDKTIETTTKNVNELQSTIEKLKENGATELSDNDEFKELSDKVKILSSDLEDMKKQLGNLSGEAFEEMSRSVDTLEGKLSNALTRLQEFREAMVNPNDIVYHIGDLEAGPNRWKAESNNRIMQNMKFSDFDSGEFGYGILGTGVYNTTVVKNEFDHELAMGGRNPKGYAIDLSKYKLLKASIDEEAEKLLGFLSQLQGYVLAEGSGYDGWDDVLKGVSTDTLYKQFVNAFGETAMDIKEFSDFVDSMIAQVAEMASYGYDEEGNFKIKGTKFDHSDTAVTQLLKKLGYEGVDLRGTTYDSYEQGNTIFDLHPEDIIKTFNTQEELDTYWENNKKAIEKFNTASAQALGEAGKNIQNLTEYVEELNKRLETLAETVNALGDLSGIKDAAEAMSGAAVAGIQQGQHSHSPSVDGGNEGDNLVNGYVNSINEGTEKARAAGENLSKAAVAGLSETSTQDIENQLNSDFSEATQSQEKFELAIINTNNELQRMAELAFRADTNVNEIDRFANQSQVLKAHALETERIAREEAERTAEIARQNAEYERQQEILRGAAEAAFRMDAGQTGASQFNKLLNDSYKQTQLQVDETVRITQAQMEQTAQMEKQYDLAKNFENAISDYADEISRAEGNAEDLAASLKKAVEVTKNADAGSSLDTLSSIQDEVRANTESAKKSINSMLKSLDTLDKPDKYVEDFIADVRSLSSSLKELSQQEILDPAEVAKFESVLKKLQEASRLDVNKNFKELTRTKYLDQISQYLTKYTGLSKGTREEINKIAEAMRKANSAGELKELYDQFLKLKVGAREAGEEIQSTFTKIGNRLADMNAKFIAQFLSFQDLVRYLRQVADNVIAVDSAITELRKVSDASTERLNESFQKSSETALQLGQSIEHVINVTADWARLGYDVDAAEELARVTALFTTVGDNMSADDASSYLISTLQGFQMSADQAEDIVDKYNQVANNFAIDTAGIGEALQRSAASFNAANTDLSKSIALITATNEVVQNPESVGTLWKTMSARIRGAATELENLGEEQDEFTKTTSKLRDLVQGLTGFDIMKTEDEFKDIYEIILGIGEAWDDLTDIEQASLGEALAGKRNANALFAVLGNLDTLKGAYEAAEDAAGSAAREQENYAKSVQYSLDRLQASIEKLSVDFLNSNFLKGLVESGVSLLDVLDQIVSKTNGLTSIAAGLGAGFGFLKIGGVDAISSSLREVQDNYAVLSASIEKYNKVAEKAAATGKTNVAQFIKADNAMGDYIRSLNGASGSMKGYVGHLISARLKTIALNVATTALNAAITMGISFAITGLVSWISKLITAEQEARQAAVDLAETYEQESESLDTQIEQYKKLYEQLDKARAKGEDTYAIKEQLSALQGELNKKYGDEFDKLNLVNGAYTDQINILKELSKEKAKDYLATNADQFDKAFDYLDKQRTYNLGELTLNEDTRGLLPILEKYGIDTNTDGTMFLPVQLKANIEDADEAMTALYADIKDYEKTHDVDLSFITDAISGQKQDIDADEKFEQYKKLRESYIDATIASDDAMAAQYQKGLEAVQAYNDALDSGENVEKAKANLEAIQNEINNTSFDNEGIRNRFLSIFDGIDEELEKRSVIDNAFDVEGNKFIEYAEKLRGLTDIDLYNLDDSQLKGAFNYLLHSFGLTTENAGLLIDKLVELGIVQRNVATSAEQLAAAENSWSSERDAALEKLGLLKETSSGTQYDESWAKYLDTIRQLNPELADNQEELEKCALANMQFSHAIDDLSKNFDSYKSALQDANALTPEYSNAINALADDLTYLTGINFSISEASDFLADVNNLELLEKAINGSDEALQQLQKHAAESVKIHVDVSELEQLQEYTDVRIALGLDTENFNAQLQGFADWLAANENIGEIDVKALLDEFPFLAQLDDLMRESSAVAQAVKTLFDSLGWDVKWTTRKIPVATGSKIQSIYAPQEVRSKYENAGSGSGAIKYDDVLVPDNFHYVPNGGRSGGRTSTSKYTPTSFSPSQKSSAASNLGGGSSGGGGSNSDAEEKEDDYKETIDFFERLITVLDQQIDLLDAHLQDVVGSFAKNMILDAEEDAIKKKMAGYSSAVEMYSQKAAEALSKIPGEIAEKVQSGAVAIDEFIGESNKDVVDAINDYQGWADKVADCKQQIVELREALRQLELQKFQNVAQDFQELFDVRNTQIDLISKAISLFETDRTKVVGRGFYDKQIEQTEKQLTDLYAKHTALSDQMTKAIANGVNITAPCYSNVA